MASSAEIFSLEDFLALTGKTKPERIIIPQGVDELVETNKYLVDAFGNLYGYSTTNYDRELVDNGSNIALFGSGIPVATTDGSAENKEQNIQVYLNHPSNNIANVNKYTNQHVYGRVVVTLIKHKYEIVSGTGTEMNPFVIK